MSNATRPHGEPLDLKPPDHVCSGLSGIGNVAIHLGLDEADTAFQWFTDESLRIGELAGKSLRDFTRSYRRRNRSEP
jgi:hypothetical protein